MTYVRITSGSFAGFVGHLSYDADGTEWITFRTSEGWRDAQAQYVFI